jgi:cytochrome c oxidase cbb3-type subunit III
MSRKHVDKLSGTETTGHEWDGIRELNNPLPRWWLWTFYATIVFAIGYVIYYPAIPLIHGATPGLSHWTSRGAVQESLNKAALAQTDNLAKLSQMSLADIRKDEALDQFAVAGGHSAFKVYCSQCHGSGAEGAKGYPNLNDDDWLWGGTPDAILQTIAHGIRFAGDDDTRVSEMPNFGSDGILTPEQINQVANYVAKLSGSEHDDAAATAGQQIFVDNCVACHGDDGKGNRELGAPNLTDPIWLYGAGVKAITAQISRPRHGVMPAWGGRLSEATLKQLALYVHSLGGGE